MPKITGTASQAVSLRTGIQTLSISAGAFTVHVAPHEMDYIIRSNLLDPLRNGPVPDIAYTYFDDPSSTDSEASGTQLAAKWLYAATKPTVHMEADLEGLTSLANLVHGDTITTANARAVALAAAWTTHIAGVGTVTANGEHKAADTTNTLPANPTNLATLKTWIGAVSGGATGTAAAIIGHGNQAGVHFLADTGAGGTGFTLSVDPPVTQDDCNDDLNDILTAMKTHFNLGAAVLPP